MALKSLALTRSRSSGALVNTREPRSPWHLDGVREGLAMPVPHVGRAQADQGPPNARAAPSDEELQLVGMRAIEGRERYLSLLTALLQDGPGPLPADESKQRAYAEQLAARRHQVSAALHGLRLAGVAVVEAIVHWRRRRQRPYEPFMWMGHNYLLKQMLDIFFLGLSASVGDAVEDPFLLHCFVDESALPAPTATKAEAGAALRQRQLSRLFSPQYRHTRPELMRIWAAERVLGSERAQLGDAFAPVAPETKAADRHLRLNAAIIFYGTIKGDGQSLSKLAAHEATLYKAPASPVQRARAPDPAHRPPPRQGATRA